MATAPKKAGRPGPPNLKTQATETATTQFEAAKDERRVRNIGEARTMFTRLMTDNELRFATIRNTRNQLEGGRPMDPNVLDQQGASWQTNINFGDAEAQRDRTLMPYWKMVHDVPHAIAVTVDTPTPNADKYAVAFAEGFDKFLSDWGSNYLLEYMNMANNFVNFGPGITQWADLDDPRWRSVNVQRVVWPKNTRMSTDQWDMVALVQDCSPAELYSRIRTAKNRERSEAAGWNVKAVEGCIAYFKDGTFAPDPRDYTRWQDLFVNNDLAVATPLQPLQLVWLFVKQFADGKHTGKVGCYVFSQQGGVEDFLFRDEEFCDDFGETLRCVWYNTGVDSMVHSIKGFATKNYYFALLQNRMKSRLVDASIFSFGINFQRSNENVPDEAPPIENYGPVTVFPPGMTQLAIYPQIQQAQSVLAMLDNNQASNNALYREQSQQIQETDTATQAKILAGMQGALSEASASIYLAQVGEIFSEQMRKLRKRGNKNADAVKFVQRMRDKNIPDEVIFDTEITVKTGANATMANPIMRSMKYQQLYAMTAGDPSVNRRWLLENIFANELGSQNNAMLPEGEGSNPLQRRQALMENQDFGQGAPLPVAPSDDHAIHAETHLTPLEGIIGLFQKQGNITPDQTIALALGVEHTGEHMGYLNADKTQKAAFQQLNPRFRMVQSATRGILTRVSQQPNNGESPSPVAQFPQ